MARRYPLYCRHSNGPRGCTPLASLDDLGKLRVVVGSFRTLGQIRQAIRLHESSDIPERFFVHECVGIE